MSRLFFEIPILNSPNDYPSQHWELDETGQPTQKVVAARRRAEFIIPHSQIQKAQSQRRVRV
jgi:type III restriction enzyme